MKATEQHNRSVDSLAKALGAFVASTQSWTMLTRARWQPLAEFPDRCYTFDVLLLPSDEKVEWDEARGCFGPGLKPVTAFDVVGKHCYDFDEFIDKGDDLCLAGGHEYCVWDPSEECLRPSFQAWRRHESVLRRIRTSARGVFFSEVGFRLGIGGSEVELSPSGDPRVEEELFTCQQLLDDAQNRANRERTAMVGLTAKLDRLRAQLGRLNA